MTGNRLYKSEKLCSRLAIARLFGGEAGRGTTAYPLRAVYAVTPDDASPTRFLISIPKKRHRRAVARVLLRRRVREAYRLNRTRLADVAAATRCHVDIAFLYLSNDVADYRRIEQQMCLILDRIAADISNPQE